MSDLECEGCQQQYSFQELGEFFETHQESFDAFACIKCGCYFFNSLGELDE